MWGGGVGGSKTEARVWLGVRERLAGRRVAQSERYCLGLNVSKAKRMMPGEAGGPAWLSGSRGVPTPRCQHVKRWMEGGDERQAKRVETDLEGDKQRD